MRPLLLLLLAVLAAPFARGQVSTAHGDAPRYIFSVQRYGVEEGLPDRRVLSLALDQRGFLWAATLQGLVRFDGRQFVLHTRNEGLSSDVVRAVACDGDGFLWVGNLDDRIDILDPVTSRARPFAEHFAGQELPDRDLASGAFIRADDGSMVIGTTGALVMYHPKGRNFEEFPFDLPCRLEPLASSDDGTTWCWCRRGNIFDLVRITRTPSNEASSSVEIFPHAYGAPRPGHDHSGWKQHAAEGTYVLQDDNGCMTTHWIGAEGEAIELGGDRTPCATYRDAWGTLSMPLTDDTWMLGTKVKRMRAGDDPLLAPVLFDLAAAYPESAFLVNDILRDPVGHIWVATDFGLFKLRMRQDHFQRLLHDPALVRDHGKRVRGMAMIDGKLHVNTEREGYHMLDPRTGELLRWEASDRFRGALIAARGGGVWRGVGTHMIRESAGGHLLRSVPLPGENCEPWSALELEDGDLLVGCSGGMYRIAEAGTAQTVEQRTHPALASAWVWHLGRDRQGRILACTSQGLFVVDESGQGVERWWSGADRDTDAAHYLPTDDIRHFHEDGHGVFWLSTATRGLLRWDPTAGSVRTISHNEGLPVTSIHAVYEDDSGLFWMPTNNGLVRYDPNSGQVRVFTTAEGIAFDEFNRIAHAKGPDGELYFGGLNGITAFLPSMLRTPDTAPSVPLVIISVYLQAGDSARPRDLSRAVIAGEPITLRPSDRYFTIDMALLSYDDPAQVRYAWRLEGIDVDWNMQREPQLRFASLPFGEHLLRVKALDAEGRWSPNELTIPIHVVRPLFLRWWFITGAALLLAFIIYFAVQYRIRQLRNVLLVRDRIALDLHDEVGSKLSSIVLFSAAVQNNTSGLSDKSAGMLARIADNSRVAMESMNDIVWSVNSANDTMADLLHRMRAYARPLCEAAGIELHFDLPQELLVQQLGMVQRKSLYLIFKEAINNAVRHSACRHITVAVHAAGSAVDLVVSDDGTGLQDSSLRDGQLGGNGLGNMRRRAEEVGGTLHVAPHEGGGTRITFHCPARST